MSDGQAGASGAKSSRRTFAIGATLVGLTGAYFGFKWLFGDPRDVTVAVLERRCGDMYVNHDTFERFAGDYAAWKGRNGLLRRLSTLSWPLSMWSPYEWVSPQDEIRRFEDSIVTQYLLSTDFFAHGGDPRREIKYVAFYDPVGRPCANPFHQPA